MYKSKNFVNNRQRQHHRPYQWTSNKPQIIYHQEHLGYDYQETYQKQDCWCETCDRGFPNITMLEKHKLQHQKCNIDGCQFIAHPKVITKHIQMQHSSGLFKKIANLNKPEDIKKWIEERKNKYPTKDNIERKSAVVKEKIERGEKMGLKRDKNASNFKSGGDFKRKASFNNDNHKRRNFGQNYAHTKNFDTKINTKNSQRHINKHTLQKRNQKSIPLLDDNRKLNPFTGIRDLVVNCDEDDTEQENCNYVIDDDDEVQESLGKEPEVCGALSSLIFNYGLSDEETELTNDIPITEPAYKHNVKTESAPQQNNKLNTVGINDFKKCSDDDSGPEEVKVGKIIHPECNNDPGHVTVPSKNLVEKKMKKNDSISNKKGIVNRRTKSKLPSTLLQKLLCNEIRHERNVVLQCIRYIVQNNYFVNVK